MAIERAGKEMVLPNGLRLFFGIEWNEIYLGLRSLKLLAAGWALLEPPAGMTHPATGTRATGRHWTLNYTGPFMFGQSYDANGVLDPGGTVSGDLVSRANTEGIRGMVEPYFNEHAWILSVDPDVQATAPPPPPTQGSYTTSQQVGAALQSLVTTGIAFNPDGTLRVI